MAYILHKLSSYSCNKCGQKKSNSGYIWKGSNGTFAICSDECGHAVLEELSNFYKSATCFMCSQKVDRKIITECRPEGINNFCQTYLFCSLECKIKQFNRSDKVRCICGNKKRIGSCILCSGCGDKHYCSTECEKKDWNVHRFDCSFVKRDNEEVCSRCKESKPYYKHTWKSCNRTARLCSDKCKSDTKLVELLTPLGCAVCSNEITLGNYDFYVHEEHRQLVESKLILYEVTTLTCSYECRKKCLSKLKKVNKMCVCGKIADEKQKFKKCSRCEYIFYCSTECQEKDWPTHKDMCNSTRE